MAESPAAASAMAPQALELPAERAGTDADVGEQGLPRVVSSGEREGFLDALRAIAILRVIAWHAFGVATITYVVAAMPAMFFVTGSLLAKSFTRRAARTVLFDRFRRLFVPLWVFGLVAWVAMAVAARFTGEGLPLHRALAWVIPLTDPHGTVWEAGWLSSHLWYLRTLTWLFLLSPLLLRAARAHRVLALAVPVAAVFVLDVLSRGAQGLPFGGETAWVAGDLALYSIFLMAGFLHRDGAFQRVSRFRWLAVALAAGAAAAVWRVTQPVPLGVVNNSHPLHLFVGAAWLGVALAAQGTLARLAAWPVTAGPIRAIGRHALTIYLWHTAAIILAINVLDARSVENPAARALGLVLLTAVGVVAAVRLFGWVEDVAARRRAAPRPRPRPILVGAVTPSRLAFATLVSFSTGLVVAFGAQPGAVHDAAAADRSSRRPPIPSKPPPAPVFHTEVTPAPPAPQLDEPEAQDAFADRFDGLVQEWAASTGIRGALVGISVGSDRRWTGATGVRADTGAPVLLEDAVDLASLTKLFTATLVHRVADVGLIDLSAPVPFLQSLPDFPYDEGITVLQLLQHNSGLVNYRDTQQFLTDPESIGDPATGVRASLAAERLAGPGERYDYSSTNFLLLGLLLEEVTGRPYDDLLGTEIVAPLGLDRTVHRPPAPAEPRGGTAGIETTIDDLLTAGVAILRNGGGLSEEEYGRMTAVDVLSGYGPGTFGFCPCRLDDEGNRHFFAIGYFGATTLLAYAPSLDMTIAVDLLDMPPADSEYAPVIALFHMIEELSQGS